MTSDVMALAVSAVMIVVLCAIGTGLSVIVPQRRHYLLGFCMGLIVGMVLCLLRVQS